MGWSTGTLAVTSSFSLGNNKPVHVCCKSVFLIMTSDFLNSLIGTWNLISYTAASVTDPSDILLPLGACRGRAIFSLDGYVSAYIQATNIQPYSEGRFHASTEELANAAKRTIAYTAPYRLEEDKAQSSKATIYYDVEMSMPPNWIGTTEIRVLEIEKGDDGDMYMYLRPPGTVELGGVVRKVEVKTRRAGDNSHGGKVDGGKQKERL